MEARKASYGSGSLTESAAGSGIWRYRYYEDGERRRATFGTKQAPLTKKQAERAARNFEPAEPTTAAPVNGRTFGALLTEWLDYGRTKTGKPWAPRTAFDNRRQVEKQIVPALGFLPLLQLSARDLENAYSKWSASGLSDGTVHRLAALISSALSFAWRRDEVLTNVAVKAVAPAQPRSKTKVPTADEVAKLLKAAEVFGKDMPRAIAIAALTGARAGEVAALRWEDIDLKAGRIRIERNVSKVGSKLVIGPTKTGTPRVARVENGNLKVLKAALGQPGPADTYVIDGGTQPIRPNVITDRFTSVRGLAHVRGVTFHSLRHFYGTSLLNAGVSPHDAAAGVWATPRMLIETYGHTTKTGSDKAAAVELLPS